MNRLLLARWRGLHPQSAVAMPGAPQARPSVAATASRGIGWSTSSRAPKQRTLRRWWRSERQRTLPRSLANRGAFPLVVAGGTPVGIDSVPVARTASTSVPSVSHHAPPSCATITHGHNSPRSAPATAPTADPAPARSKPRSYDLCGNYSPDRLNTDYAVPTISAAVEVAARFLKGHLGKPDALVQVRLSGDRQVVTTIREHGRRGEKVKGLAWAIRAYTPGGPELGELVELLEPPDPALGAARLM